MTENELATIAVDVAYQIHTRLGPGLLESVYHAIMLHELKKRGLAVEFEKPAPVIWDEVQLEVGFRADLIVEGKLILELWNKSPGSTRNNCSPTCGSQIANSVC